MGRKLAAAVLSLSLAVLLTEPAGAHTGNVNTSLSVAKIMSRTRALVYGVLSATGADSPEADCKTGKTVQLVRVGGTVLGSDITDSEGEFSFGLLKRKKKSYQVFARFAQTVQTSYGHSHTCQASQSNTITIKKKKRR